MQVDFVLFFYLCEIGLILPGGRLGAKTSEDTRSLVPPRDLAGIFCSQESPSSYLSITHMDGTQPRRSGPFLREPQNHKNPEGDMDTDAFS
ncbi:hypothetical protein E2C01_004170 [Portunus trituberculatus]|uniref:Uncharacterized protein n=1 Tax=Portunus trituberculatus TaxID=210409 RepID=A0A5B7CVM4_PORTR|nr:hypothetical protein [Portunus trituberculatus]